MKFISNLSDNIKGIFLIIAGAIILFDTLGYATELLHSIVLFGSVAMIIIGVFMSNIPSKVMRSIAKKDNDKDNEQMPPQS